MTRRGAAFSATLLSVVAVATLLAGPAAASHGGEELEVTVALNAAGDDRITVRDATFDSTNYVRLGSEVAIALDRPVGGFHASEDLRGGVVELDDKLAQPDGRGGQSFNLDTGKLQLLAQRRSYDAIVLVVCTPKVAQIVNSLVAPQRSPRDSPSSRCRGWYQPVDEPALRAVVQLLPDRQRYPSAVLRSVGAAAITFGLLGLGATLLRRGALKRRSLASWLLSIGAVLLVVSVGWVVVTLTVWMGGAAADPMLLGGGTISEQVARTLLPGLVFIVPALLPAAILLSAARKEKQKPSAPGPLAPAGPPVPTWWPAPWWQQWAAQGGSQPPPGPTSPPEKPPPAPPNSPPGGSSGWAPPGAGSG